MNKPMVSNSGRTSPVASVLPGLRDDLARLAGRENAARGDALLTMLREHGLNPEVQRFGNPARERDDRAEGRNLIVTLGRGPRDIVVGAHYDAACMPNGRVSEGVVDNGAGAIVIVRLAAALARGAHGWAHRLRLVLFDLEEAGQLGSAAYVGARPAERTCAMVNVDIAALGDTLVFGPTANEGNTGVHRAVRRAAAASDLEAVEFAVLPRSDDRSFQAAGIPNVSLSMAPRAEAYQGWLLLHAGSESGLREGFVPRTLSLVHTPEDRLELADSVAMTRLHGALMELVFELDSTMAGLEPNAPRATGASRTVDDQEVARWRTPRAQTGSG